MNGTTYIYYPPVNVSRMQVEGILVQHNVGAGFRSPHIHLEKLVKEGQLRCYVSNEIDPDGRGPFQLTKSFEELVNQYGISGALGSLAEKAPTDDDNAGEPIVLDPTALNYIESLSKADFYKLKEHAVSEYNLSVKDLKNKHEAINLIVKAFFNKSNENLGKAENTPTSTEAPKESDTTNTPTEAPKVSTRGRKAAEPTPAPTEAPEPTPAPTA